MINYLTLIAYIAFAQTAVLLVKLGSSNAGLTIQDWNFTIFVNIKMLVGLCLYMCSFLLWIVVLSRNNLSIVTPAITGANYIIPMAIGIFLLHEKMSPQQWAGAGLILLGLIVSNLHSSAG